MTNDIKIPQELAERLLNELSQCSVRNELRALLATPAVCICRGCFTEQPSGTACVTCAKVEAERAAPVVERQEPIYQVQYLGDGGGGWSDAEKASYDAKVPHPKHWQTRIVYASPPAPVAVVLPARRDTPEYWNPYQNPSAERACGWNGYDDELKRLNPGLFAKVKD